MTSLTLDVARMQATRPVLPAATERKMDEAAREFESVFLSQMFETVWQTVPTDGAMGGGMGESIFRSMMVQDIGKQFAQQGGIGLAPYIKAELLKIQEGKGQ
jgi:Rod binding domain-containing protein